MFLVFILQEWPLIQQMNYFQMLIRAVIGILSYQIFFKRFSLTLWGVLDTN